MNLPMKQRQTCGCQWEEGQGMGGLGVWNQQMQTTIYQIDIYSGFSSNCVNLLPFQITNKVLLYSTENYLQYLVIKHDGKYYVYMCVTESLCCAPETN